MYFTPHLVGSRPRKEERGRKNDPTITIVLRLLCAAGGGQNPSSSSRHEHELLLLLLRPPPPALVCVAVVVPPPPSQSFRLLLSVTTDHHPRLRASAGGRAAAGGSPPRWVAEEQCNRPAAGVPAAAAGRRLRGHSSRQDFFLCSDVVAPSPRTAETRRLITCSERWHAAACAHSRRLPCEACRRAARSATDPTRRQSSPRKRPLLRPLCFCRLRSFVLRQTVSPVLLGQTAGAEHASDTELGHLCAVPPLVVLQQAQRAVRPKHQTVWSAVHETQTWPIGFARNAGICPGKSPHKEYHLVVRDSGPLSEVRKMLLLSPPPDLNERPCLGQGHPGACGSDPVSL